MGIQSTVCKCVNSALPHPASTYNRRLQPRVLSPRKFECSRPECCGVKHNMNTLSVFSNYYNYELHRFPHGWYSSQHRWFFYLLCWFDVFCKKKVLGFLAPNIFHPRTFLAIRKVNINDTYYLPFFPLIGSPKVLPNFKYLTS